MSVLQNAVREAAFTPNSKSGPTKLLRWKLHSASQHLVAIPLNSVCEHLCFYLDLLCTSINKTGPKAIVSSSLFAISACERLHRSLCFWIVGETCI